MKVIYKYPLQITDAQTLMVPRGTYSLSVQMQKGALVLWALVDTSECTIPVSIRIFGTGHPVDLTDTAAFLGTVQDCGGDLVWHVFAEAAPPCES